MIAWSKVKPVLGTYADKLKPLWENGEIERIFTQLKEEKKNGAEIAPTSDIVFRALIETPIDKLRCVMVGDYPYSHKINDKQVADGLLLGASNHAEDKDAYLPDELKIWYAEVEKEFCSGLCLSCISDGYISYFLSKEGILMWNVSLSTVIGKEDVHHDLWAPFQAYFFQHIIAPLNLPVITLGGTAYDFCLRYIKSELVFNLPHPREANFQTKSKLKQVQQLVKQKTGYEIDFTISLPF